AARVCVRSQTHARSIKRLLELCAQKVSSTLLRLLCPIVGWPPTTAPIRAASRPSGAASGDDIMTARKRMSLRDLRRGISFRGLGVGMLFVAFAVIALVMPAQNDTFWHLRAGQDIWRLHSIPRIDSYSNTFAGAAWPDHEWLSQAMIYGV